jgi:phosphoribosylformimino-5-aminoimidazole carboxamide ribotide isomerase
MEKEFATFPFEIYPAIDLRGGQVVRLRTGDPAQQTIYSISPEQAAQEWCSQGAKWLHVVNLDGAFGEASQTNWQAAEIIMATARAYGVKVQFGGGIRSLEALAKAFEMGADRVVLGTVLVENPELLPLAIARWGNERIAAGVDARSGVVQVRGWLKGAGVDATDLAQKLVQQDLIWMVYTDISRDGTGQGANLVETAALAQRSGLRVIASGGFDRPDEVAQAKALGLAGVILGRALYEGKIELRSVLELVIGGENAG